MKIPKFILGDHSEYPNSIFVIHTEFPRFIIDLENDEIEWLEVFDTQDEKELKFEAENAIIQASAFYDSEINKYKQD
jgi:hypothetical protein